MADAELPLHRAHPALARALARQPFVVSPTPVEPLRLEGAAPEGFACGTKRYCREMTSCAEARFHLVRCGLTRLDADGDGRPCEALCAR